MTRNYLTLVTAGALFLIAGLTARADYSSAVLADGPLTYHRFNEAGVTNDTVPVVVNLGTLGAAANGTHVTTYRDDLIQQGVPGALADPDNTAISIPYSPNTHFNYVKVPWQEGLAHNGPFSFEIWAKPATRCMNYMCGMANWSADRSGWVLMQSDWDDLVTGNGWVFRLFQNSGSTSSDVYDTFAIDTNHWYHLVGVYDGSSATLYIDGVPAHSASVSAYAPAIGSNLMFGVTRNIQFPYGGGLDEAAFYTNALTAEEVAAHYACATTNPTYYPTLVLAKNPPGYWRFNEKFNPSVALNSGTCGAAADGQYRIFSTTVPELQGPAYPGFEPTNRALRLFGTNGCVVFPALNFYTNTVTYECLLKRSGTQKDYTCIFMHGRVLLNPSPFVAGLIFRGTGNALGYYWYSTNTAAAAGESFNYQSTLVPPNETWVYAALAITPTSGTIYMYDGTNWSKAVNTRAHKMAHFIGPTWIGGDRNVPNRWFNGCVDEAAFYDKTLTEGQLRSHALAAFGDASAPEFIDPTPVVEPSMVYAGTPFKLTIDGYGPPPVSFQWRRGDGANQSNIEGATNATYLKASASAADNGNYDVVISGSFGAVTSYQAYVYVYPQDAPSISQNPVSRAVYPGGSVKLSVAADGQALTYQWMHAGTNLPGATTSTLTVANVDETTIGEYRVRVTNTAGTQLSAAATLSLIPYDSNNTYVSAVLADAPEAYWRLDETAAPIIYDSMGRHDGQTWAKTPAYDPAGSQWGPAWNKPGALADDPNTALAFNGNNFISVPYSPDLNVPTYTIEVWAMPTTISSATYYPVVSEDFYTAPTQVTPPCLPDNYRGGYRFSLTGSSKQWNFGVGGMTTWDVVTDPAPTTVNSWVHLVGTFDGWRESFYVNGVFVGSFLGLGLPNERLALYIGGDNAAYGFGNPFLGVVDEVAYYKTVLPPSRIKLHYQLGKHGTNGLPVFITSPASQTVEVGSPVSFSATLVGATPMTYQWQQNGASLPTGTDLTLSFASVDYANAGQYTLTVTNDLGDAISSAATLVVTPPASVTNLTSRISHTPAGVKLELLWPMGCDLYYATNLTTSPWLPVSGAAAPYYNVPINPGTEQMYYRCICP